MVIMLAHRVAYLHPVGYQRLPPVHVLGHGLRRARDANWPQGLYRADWFAIDQLQ